MKWNSKQYLQFEKERTRPSLDLIKRVEKESLKTALDVGCGPGNSSAVVKRAFPEAIVYGIDASEEMIKTARESYSDIRFENRDVDEYVIHTDQTFDLIFSNACLQWLPNQLSTIENLSLLLNKNGILAVQVPANSEEPVTRIIEELAVSDRWKEKLQNVKTYSMPSLDEFYDCLTKLPGTMELWTTIYHHVLPSHQAILDWYEGSGLRPYLARLEEHEKMEFKNEFLERVKGAYLCQKDGSVIFDFPRLFFTVEKTGF